MTTNSDSSLERSTPDVREWLWLDESLFADWLIDSLKVDGETRTLSSDGTVWVWIRRWKRRLVGLRQVNERQPRSAVISEIDRA